MNPYLSHTQASRQVLLTLSKPITVRDFINRVMKLMNEYGDADELAIKCGLNPDDLVKPSASFSKEKLH